MRLRSSPNFLPTSRMSASTKTISISERPRANVQYAIAANGPYESLSDLSPTKTIARIAMMIAAETVRYAFCLFVTGRALVIQARTSIAKNPTTNAIPPNAAICQAVSPKRPPTSAHTVFSTQRPPFVCRSRTRMNRLQAHWLRPQRRARKSPG